MVMYLFYYLSLRGDSIMMKRLLFGLLASFLILGSTAVRAAHAHQPALETHFMNICSRYQPHPLNRWSHEEVLRYMKRLKDEVIQEEATQLRTMSDGCEYQRAPEAAPGSTDSSDGIQVTIDPSTIAKRNRQGMALEADSASYGKVTMEFGVSCYDGHAVPGRLQADENTSYLFHTLPRIDGPQNSVRDSLVDPEARRRMQA